MSEEPTQASLRERLKKLRHGADLLAYSHSCLRDYYNNWNYWLTIGSLVPTAALLLFPLTSDDFVTSTLHMSINAFKLLNAGVALLAFIMVLVQMVWRPDARSKLHRRAVHHYTQTKYETRRLIEAEGLDDRAVGLVEQNYLDDGSLPVIEQNRFLRLKEQHLQRLAASRRLDESYSTL